MKLELPTWEDCQQVRLWRNQAMSTLRTSHQLTEEIQRKFYDDVICNPGSPHRYWSVIIKDQEPSLMGFGGITNIQWENRLGEISLIIAPSLRGKGVGEKAVDLLLDKAFNYMNLQTVCGECYYCNPAIEFWEKIVFKYNGNATTLLNKKYWNGRYWGSRYFSIDRGDYDK